LHEPPLEPFCIYDGGEYSSWRCFEKMFSFLSQGLKLLGLIKNDSCLIHNKRRAANFVCSPPFVMNHLSFN